VTPWEVLGLQPTSDRRAIKKAYVLRLKTTHPEDDPLGFQELREAYEIALDWAGFEERRASEPGETRKPPSKSHPPPAEPGRDRHQGALQDVERLIERVRFLHADEEKRGSEDAWRAILADDSLWSLDVRAGFAGHLFGFLLEAWQDLDRQVLVLLEEEFRFREDGLRLHRFFGPPESVDAVLTGLNRAFSERPLRGFENRQMFQLTESRSGGWLDERLESLDRLDDKLQSLEWLTNVLRPLPKGTRFAVILVIAGNLIRNCDAPTSRDEDLLEHLRSNDVVVRLEAAARLGNPQATNDLAELYLTGNQGVRKDRSKALELFRGAANRGNAIAQRHLGEACLEGWAGEKNLAAAAEWFGHAAAQGEPEAQFQLAVMHFRGEGIPKDEKTALTWLRRAAAYDHAMAKAWLGYMHEEGRGVQADSFLAAQWYRKAAEQEVRWAQFRLGRLLAEGPESLRNPESAFFWLHMASGDEKLAADAAPLLAKVRSELSPEQIRALEDQLQRWIGHLAKNRSIG
jgi:TPR repeat protein